MSSDSSTSSGGGNTRPPQKQISPAKNWVLTLNNYTAEELELISSIVPKVSKFYHIGYEEGEQGTPHLQGFIVFTKKCRPSSHKLPNRIHWEKMKGRIEQSITYCQKDGKPFISEGCPRPIHVFPMELEWQKELLKKIETHADVGCRMIHWIWSHKGGTRKTSTCRYLAVKHNALIMGGKAHDVRHGIAKWKETYGNTPDLVVINIPKSFSPEYVSYEGFENIKDMLFYSGKYEGGMVVGNPPHLFIFANFHPDTSKMTEEGRWNIINIDPDDYVDEAIDMEL